ncbi:DUF971 domain-containing protein [bacterium]|nr:DUF971 domain-containing protein [bacterium]
MTNTQIEQQILDQLSQIQDPDLNQDIVSLGFVKNLIIADGVASFTLELTTPACPVKDVFKTQAEELVGKIDGINEVRVRLSSRSYTGLKPMAKGLANVSNVIAVSSCKGGVGKSTTAVNLAFSLANAGAKVGIFDADVYGPSLPTMVYLPKTELYFDGELIKPLQFKGVKLMSFAYTVGPEDDQNPAIMRGPMVSQVINQLLTQTNWGELDYLVIDMPPGTGDIQITLTQLIPITAAVIVTTPQRLSFVDVVKGIEMFDRMKVPTVAVVENMSYFNCDNCTERHYPFGRGALQSLVNEFGFKNTLEFPIHPDVSPAGDSGTPYVIEYPYSEVGKLFTQLSESVVREISRIRHGQMIAPKVELYEPNTVVISIGDRQYELPARDLRLNCRCARCEDEFTGRTLIQADDIPGDVLPVGMSPVGNYAIGVNWSDQHSSIYPYDYMISISTPRVTVTEGDYNGH